MTWLLTILSLTGVVLNIKKRRAGFFFWVPSNIGWAIIAFRAHLPALGVLWIVYAGLAVWGLWEWRKKYQISDIDLKKLNRQELEARCAFDRLFNEQLIKEFLQTPGGGKDERD